MSDVEIEKNAKTKDSKTERWISTAYSEHTVIEKVDGVPIAIKFKDYALDLDLSNERDRKVSEALRKCPRFKRDILVVGEKYPDNMLSEKSVMLDKLQQMSIEQLRVLFNVAELDKAGIPSRPTAGDKQTLIMLALTNKSI